LHPLMHRPGSAYCSFNVNGRPDRMASELAPAGLN
jgi:hypothetical protein